MSDLSIENAINPTSAGKLMHQGMPPLEMDGPALSHFEFWSPRVFYIPIVLQTIWLSLRHMGPTLPTSANPHFPMGGLVGESKKIVLSLAGETAKEFITVWLSKDAKEKSSSSPYNNHQKLLKPSFVFFN